MNARAKHRERAKEPTTQKTQNQGYVPRSHLVLKSAKEAAATCAALPAPEAPASEPEAPRAEKYGGVSKVCRI